MIIVTAIIFAVFLIGYRNSKIEEKKFIMKCADEFGSAPSARLKKQRDDISGYFKENISDYSVDDITWNDLDMHTVYDRLNYCETSSGEEYLYYMLRTPQTEDTGIFAKMEKELEALSGSEDERCKIKQCLLRVGKSGKYSIYDYLPLIDKANPGSDGFHILMLIIMAGSIFSMVFFNFMIGFLILITAMAINVVSYYKIKASLQPYMVTFSYVLRLIRGGRELLSLEDCTFYDEIREIKECTIDLKSFTKGSWILMSGSKVMGSGNPIDILMDYARMLTHIDLIKFNSMYRKLQDKKESVHKLTKDIGYIDSVMSVCYYRASLDRNYCKPEFLTEKHYEIKEGCHPLMNAPVPNTFTADRGFLITGSNASGKSTFLKMCAINTILAQTIHTCICKEYRASFFRVFSSMALKDDLNLGDSYYMVEIKSLKRILDAKDDSRAAVLCFIDEVLRGTNTVERIAASSKILEFFANHKDSVMCFAATHDGELSDILGKLYDIRHFEGEMKENDVLFDYKLKDGPATKRNAINLLRTIGYNDMIVREAENMAIRFENTGDWTL